MGTRTTLPIATLTLLAASCGHPGTTSATAPGPARSSFSTRALPAPAATAGSPLFRAASAEIRTLAAGFVGTVVEYDTTIESRLAFLGHLAELVTPAELDRLAESPRARLRWRILRARSERTRLVVNGVTLDPGLADGVRVIVEAALTTHTSFASVTGFHQYTLTIARAGDLWVVDRADGIDP